MRVCVETVSELGIHPTDAMASKHGQQYWPPTETGPYGSSAQKSGNSQQLPYDPNDPVLGTDMTQGEWDQLRALMRKAEAGGKVNELLTVQRKEVKNAPMNKAYPPDDEWQECDDGQQHAGQPKTFGPASENSTAPAAAGKAPAGALWPEAYSQAAWKEPPTGPPPNLQQGASSAGTTGFRDAREYHKKWQDRPYDPNDDPWIEDVDKNEKPKDKPVIQIFGNVVQKNADFEEAKVADAKKAAAAIAAIANQYCTTYDSSNSAGFPKFNAQVPVPPLAKADPPVLPAAALGSEQTFYDQKGKGKEFEKGGKGEVKGGLNEKGKGKEFEKGAKGEKGDKGEKGEKGKGKEPQFPGPKSTGHSSKCARISEEPPDVVEPNSNKIPDAGAMTDGSKRRHEAVMSASDSEDGLGSYSFISDTGDSPPLFPSFPTGLPGTHKWGSNWEADIDYEEVDFAIPKPAWIKDTYHWSCTLLKMGKFSASPISYHDFVVKVFNKSADECRYAKKMIGQFRKKLTPTPRTQGPDFCAFLMHCRVDAFLNAGYVYQREFQWR